MSHNFRVTCTTRLFQESVDERLIRERTGHKLNALFKWEKSSIEQQHQVNKILGPPAQKITRLMANFKCRGYGKRLGVASAS